MMLSKFKSKENLKKCQLKFLHTYLYLVIFEHPLRIDFFCLQIIRRCSERRSRSSHHTAPSKSRCSTDSTETQRRNQRRHLHRILCGHPQLPHRNVIVIISLSVTMTCDFFESVLSSLPSFFLFLLNISSNYHYFLLNFQFR